MDYARSTHPISGGAAGSSANYAGTATEAAESASRIRDAVGNSEQIMSGIHEQIDALEKRLDVALTPTSPNVAKDNQPVPPKAQASHLHGRLEILNDGLVHAVARLTLLRSRIEV